MKTTEQNLMSSTNEDNLGQIEIGQGDQSSTKPLTLEDNSKTTVADTMATSDKGDDNQSRDTHEDGTTNNADEKQLDVELKQRSWFSHLLAFYRANDFPIHILIAIGLAKAYPPLGAVKLNPMITAGWVATGIIFFLSGLGLDTGDFLKVVFRHVGFNVFVEVFNFGVVSSIVFGVSRALAATGALPQALADGLLMASCLPMSINAVIILTTAAHGDIAAAIFHTTVGNITGIFLSPILIVLYLPQVSTDVDLPHVFLDLTKKIIIPLVVGQMLHILVKPVREFYKAHKRVFKKIQETSLVYIV
jgi:solute carrier family 10 (sodium/bile acid cotransporter), member 7